MTGCLLHSMWNICLKNKLKALLGIFRAKNAVWVCRQKKTKQLVQITSGHHLDDCSLFISSLQVNSLPPFSTSNMWDQTLNFRPPFHSGTLQFISLEELKIIQVNCLADKWSWYSEIKLEFLWDFEIWLLYWCGQVPILGGSAGKTLTLRRLLELGDGTGEAGLTLIIAWFITFIFSFNTKTSSQGECTAV